MSLSNFYSSTSSLNNRTNTKSNSNNVCFTLPITCQICLGKVKEPCVCPNLHAFCAFCIDIWLEKTKQCPTCRIQIDKQNPCRRILGGIENLDEADVLKPTDFSHPSTRKARYMNLLQQYEDEITRLNTYIDSLNDEITKLKESGKNVNYTPSSGSSPQHDMIQILKTKLQTLQNNNEELVKERDDLKEQNKKIDSENSILIQDLARLKANLNEKNSQLTSKYTMAALESKLECYEKEIKQLQKALEKSDKYIAELENKRDLKDKENKIHPNNHLFNQNFDECEQTIQNQINHVQPNTSCNYDFKYGIKSSNSNITSNSIKFLKGNDNQLPYKNDLKNVKFSEKIDKFPISTTSNTSPTNNSNINSAKKVVISNNRFYGSPSKTPTRDSSNPAFGSNVPNVVSFNERLKKNLFNTTTTSSNFEFEAPSTSQSMISMNTNHSSNILLSNSSSNLGNTNQNYNTQNFLFSPMKRLRLDEISLEKPSFSTDESVSNNLTDNFYKNENKKYEMKYSSPTKNQRENDQLNGCTSEFIDCLELLNQAEKKVQNRQISPPKSNEFIYQSSRVDLNNQKAFDNNLSCSSSQSSGNSLAATITTGASSLASSSTAVLSSSDSSSTYFKPSLNQMKKFPSFDQNLNLNTNQNIYTNLQINNNQPSNGN